MQGELIAAVMFANYTNVSLLLIYVLGQLEYFLHPWHMNTDSNQFINIKTIYGNLRSEISNVKPELHATIGCDTTS